MKEVQRLLMLIHSSDECKILCAATGTSHRVHTLQPANCSKEHQQLTQGPQFDTYQQARLMHVRTVLHLAGAKHTTPPPPPHTHTHSSSSSTG
jgi:hypothetical protein